MNQQAQLEVQAPLCQSSEIPAAREHVRETDFSATHIEGAIAMEINVVYRMSLIRKIPSTPHNDNNNYFMLPKCALIPVSIGYDMGVGMRSESDPLYESWTLQLQAIQVKMIYKVSQQLLSKEECP